MEQGRKRMCADERLAMMNYSVGMDALEVALKSMEKRLKNIKSWGKVKGAFGIVAKTFDDVMSTVPLDQLMAFKRNYELMVWDYHVRSPMQKKDLRNDGLWLPLYALDEMVHATKDYCMTCDKSLEERRKCALAKALDLLPIMVDEGTQNGCRYFNGLE